MFVKTTTQQIWWDDTTDNWPNNQYFNSFKSSMTENNSLKINYVNSRTIEIVVPNKTISYIWVNDDKYNYYYYFDKIVKIIKGGYVLQYSLDVYTTYTLPYFNYLKDNSVNIKINRHKNFEIQALQYEDEMLKRVPRIVSSRKRRTTRTWEYKKINEEKYKATGVFGESTAWAEANFNKNFAYNRVINPMIYLLIEVDNLEYTGTTSGKCMCLVPCASARGGGSISIHLDFDTAPWWYKNTWINYITKPSGSDEDNTKWYYSGYNSSAQEIVDDLTKSGHGAKIRGVYTGPCLFSLSPKSLGIFKYTYTPSSSTRIMFVIPIGPDTGIPLSSTTYSLGNLPEGLSTSAPSSLNSTSLSIYASNELDFTIAGQQFKLFTLLNSSNNGLQLGNEAYFNFTTNGFFTIKNSMYPMNSMILNYSQELPIFQDNYTKYIQATKNVRDTGLNIAKQNMDFNISTGVINGIASIGLGIASGNYVGAASTAMNTIFGGVGQAMGYNQKKQMLEAELADKKASIQSNIQGGSISDAASAAFMISLIDGNSDKFFVGEYLEWNNYNTDTIKAMNNVLYLYGQYNPKITTISSLTYDNNFNYYKFDAEYLTNIFASTLRAENTSIPVEREFYDEIFAHMVSGLRLWKVRPSW